MYDMLGDRDYDCFEKCDHEYLKEKIAFAFFGPPQSIENCNTKNSTDSILQYYTDKQRQKVTTTYNKIREIYGRNRCFIQRNHS